MDAVGNNLSGIYASCNLVALKLDTAFFDKIRADLGKPSLATLMFVDDKLANLETAMSLG